MDYEPATLIELSSPLSLLCLAAIERPLPFLFERDSIIGGFGLLQCILYLSIYARGSTLSALRKRSRNDMIIGVIVSNLHSIFISGFFYHINMLLKCWKIKLQ